MATNAEGKSVELYIPRKCSATNRIIAANDYASIQLNIAHIDATGQYTGQYSTYAIEGNVRKMGESDAALARLAAKDGLVKDIVTAFPHHSKFQKANK